MARIFLLMVVSLLLASCITQSLFDDSGQCEASDYIIDARFDGGGMSACRVVSSDTVEVRLDPEDIPINPSPWFSFRLTRKNQAAGIAYVNLIYTEHPHRYRPKISSDRIRWSNLPDDRVITGKNNQHVSLSIPLSADPVYVSGQELLTEQDYAEWIAPFRKRNDLSLKVIGQSVEQRPIEAIFSESEQAQGSVVLVGRQHPPELTGALAMVAFVDEVLGSSQLAKDFRNRFNLVIAPKLNPDGVKYGYWRHNVNGTDLNRDWGPFLQPETQAMKRVLDRLAERANDRPVVFLDFHSTRRNVFYTQLLGEDGTDYGFTHLWLTRSGKRLPDYEFERAERHQTEVATSKNYVYGRFGVPSITYEVGDESDRGQLRIAARVFAQEMMSVLMEYHEFP